MKSNRAIRNITYDEFKAYVVINMSKFSDESRVRLNHTFKVCEHTSLALGPIIIPLIKDIGSAIDA